MVSYGTTKKTQDQRRESHIRGNLQSMRMSAESESLARNLAYLAENKRESVLEKERLQDLACVAEGLEKGRQDQTTASESGGLVVFMTTSLWGSERTH